ncbi:hypothetical protein LAPL110952_05060 [Lactiplantibacillus plajomi]
MAETTHFYETFQPEPYDIYIDINREKKQFSGKSTITGNTRSLRSSDSPELLNDRVRPS